MKNGSLKFTTTQNPGGGNLRRSKTGPKIVFFMFECYF